MRVDLSDRFIAWFKNIPIQKRKLFGLSIMLAFWGTSCELGAAWTKVHDTGQKKFSIFSWPWPLVMHFQTPEEHERGLQDQLQAIQTAIGSSDGRSVTDANAAATYQQIGDGGRLHNFFDYARTSHLKRKAELGMLTTQDVAEVCAAQIKDLQDSIASIESWKIPVIAGTNPYEIAVIFTLLLVGIYVCVCWPKQTEAFLEWFQKEDKNAAEKPLPPRQEEIIAVSHAKTMAEIRADIEEEEARRRKAAQQHQPPPPPPKEKPKDAFARRKEIRRKYEKQRQQARQSSMSEEQKRWELDWIDKREQEELNNEFI